MKPVESWSVERSLLLMSQEIMQLFFPWLSFKNIYIYISTLSVLQILLWACCWLPGNVTYIICVPRVDQTLCNWLLCKGRGKKSAYFQGANQFQPSRFCKIMATSTSLLSIAPGVWIILFLLIRQLEVAFGLAFEGVTLLMLLQRLPGCCCFCKPTASLLLLQDSLLPVFLFYFLHTDFQMKSWTSKTHLHLFLHPLLAFI